MFWCWSRRYLFHVVLICRGLVHLLGGAPVPDHVRPSTHSGEYDSELHDPRGHDDRLKVEVVFASVPLHVLVPPPVRRQLVLGAPQPNH